jgi:hypothetical protein
MDALSQKQLSGIHKEKSPDTTLALKRAGVAHGFNLR